MIIFVVTAWVRGSPNTVPIATMETRSVVLARETAKLWRKQGWQVEQSEKNIAVALDTSAC